MTYSEVLKYIIGNDTPSFELVRDVATAILQKQPDQVQQDAYDSLERGTAILYNGLQMDAYLHAYGRMHQAKLNYAFKHIPNTFLIQNEINIIDYGCGLGIGFMCFADFLRKQGYIQKINTITLIEPSKPAIQRAALHCRLFFPKANIITIDKDFDRLSEEDIISQNDRPTLHILSNVLDLDFDFEHFSLLIRDCLKGYNQFICTSPYFNDFEKDERMKIFADKLNGDNMVYNLNDKLNPNKDWTCAICCFNVGKTIHNETHNVDRLVLRPIENGDKTERVILNPMNSYECLKRQYNQGEKIIFYQNPNGVFESCSVIIKRKIKKKESILLSQILISEVCDVNKPVRIDVVNIDNETFWLLDNQWEMDVLSNMNPSFDREALVNNSKYYAIIEYNEFVRKTNNNKPIEFGTNPNGYYETEIYCLINGKKEKIKSFIRKGCNSSKPMNVRIIENNIEGVCYYAFIDNQCICNDSFIKYKQYNRLRKMLYLKKRIGVFKLDDFKRFFNQGKNLSLKRINDNYRVACVNLSLNPRQTIIAQLFLNDEVNVNGSMFVELNKDNNDSFSGTIKNIDCIIEL